MPNHSLGDLPPSIRNKLDLWFHEQPKLAGFIQQNLIDCRGLNDDGTGYSYHVASMADDLKYSNKIRLEVRSLSPKEGHAGDNDKSSKPADVMSHQDIPAPQIRPKKKLKTSDTHAAHQIKEEVDSKGSSDIPWRSRDRAYYQFEV